MGVYMYGVKRSSPIKVVMPDGGTKVAHRMQYLCLARDCDEFSLDTNRAKRLNTRFDSIERAWGKDRPEMMISVDETGKPQAVSTAYGSPSSVVWHDAGSWPASRIGAVVKVGRKYCFFEMSPEEENSLWKQSKLDGARSV
jgi:hypothetical protein